MSKTPSKSRSLEIVSNAGDIGQELSVAERRRLPRLNLSSEQFRLSSNGKIFSVVDVSTGGMALRILDPNDLILFSVGARLEGTLNLNRQKYVLKARVRHAGRDMIGCEFEDLEPAMKIALTQALDPSMLGQELKPIPSGEGAIWYHGPSGTDVLLWRGSDGQFRRMSIFIQGTFVQWESDAGLSTGVVQNSFEQSDVRGLVRFETLLLEADPQQDISKLNVAKTLLLSSNLTMDLKKWCVRQLEGGTA